MFLGRSARKIIHAKITAFTVCEVFEILGLIIYPCLVSVYKAIEEWTELICIKTEIFFLKYIFCNLVFWKMGASIYILFQKISTIR